MHARGERAAAGDGAARSEAIEEHLPLVESVARRYAGSGEPMEDLVQVGTIGLIKAIDRFEPERGLAFSTLAVPTIDGEIRHHLRDRGGVLRLPRPVQELGSRARSVQAELAARDGRTPSADEVADALDADAGDVARALAAREAATPEPLAEDEAGDHDADLAATEDRELLARGWRVLDERERHILELRYKDDLSQTEIARRVGLSQAHVSRLIRGALDRMRAELGEYSDSAMAAPGDAQTERQATHSGRLLVRMPQSLHAELARTAERENVSLNAFITGTLASAIGWRDPEGKEQPTATRRNGAKPAASAEDRPRWTSAALVANLVVVGIAAVVAIVLLIVALSHGF